MSRELDDGDRRIEMSEAPRGNVVRLPNAAPAQVISPLRIRYPSEIDGPPPPPLWLCDNMLLAGTVCLIAGASNVGKSLASMQLLTAIALGRDWMGRATEQARCLAIFCEDRPDQLDRRALAICEHYEVHNSVLDREFAWDAREDRDSVLWETEFGRGQPTQFWHQLFGERPGQGLIAEDGYRVVLLDTVAAMFQGNHNNASQVNAFMRALTREAVLHDCAIVVNMHPSRSNKSSFGGSAQWEAAARFGYSLARPKPPPGLDEDDMAYGDAGLQRVFRGLGSNYVATPRPERWRWREGVFVIDELAGENAPRRRPIGEQERRDIQYRLLMGLKRAMQHGVAVPADVMATRSLPHLARTYGDAEIRNVPLNELYLAQAALLDAGQILRVTVRGKCLLRPTDMRYANEEEWQISG